MITRRVSQPASRKKVIDKQVDRARRASSSKYVRALIRRNRAAVGESGLAAMMLEGLASGAGTIVDGCFWAKKKAALRRRG